MQGVLASARQHQLIAAETQYPLQLACVRKPQHSETWIQQP